MKFIFIKLLFVISLFAGTYDNLDSTNSFDMFMDGDFVEIVRFDRLDFSDEELSDESYEYLQEIIKTINSSINDEKDIQITIIGHSSEKFKDNALETSKDFALDIAKRFEDTNITKEIITVEFRGSKDKAFSSETSDSIDLSNRVMVTMYEIAPKDIDSDKDGVFDADDRCSNTLANVKVDEYGCPLDIDKDGVFDYQDECDNTPFGEEVDEKGCPFDDDGDGVVNHKDKCPNTPSEFNVDAHGCPISKELQLTFDKKSSQIDDESYDNIIDFADFLNRNPEYKAQIIGHTDSVGKAGENMRLSHERAYSVRSALIRQGIDASRLEAVGRGELDPIDTNRKSDGRATNRRIEIKLFK